MFKRITTLIVAALVINLVCVTPTVVGQQTGSDARAEKMKAKVIKIGTGPDARVEVRLSNGRRVKGYISESKDDYFTVVDDKAGVATRIDYAQVVGFKTPKISTKTRRILTFQAIFLGVILGAALLLVASGD